MSAAALLTVSGFMVSRLSENDLVIFKVKLCGRGAEKYIFSIKMRFVLKFPVCMNDSHHNLSKKILLFPA